MADDRLTAEHAEIAENTERFSRRSRRLMWVSSHALRSARILLEARENFARAFTELLVVRHFVSELPRFRFPRQVVVRHGDVEPRRGHHAAPFGDELLAPGN